MELQEKLLHHIWDQRHLQHELKTITGKPVKIVYQGQYNTDAGPDFKNVILNLDGQNVQGDVEIHWKTYDWTAHNHHEDPMYNNTILHVVLEHKSSFDYTLREDAYPIEILELKNQIDADIAKLFAQYRDTPPQKHIGLCDFFSLSSEADIKQLLKANGWERFQKKCARFNAELMFNSFDRLIYNGIMEAMGYEKNKFHTLAIAQQFNWEQLKEWRLDGMDALTLAAIWLNYAGLNDKTETILGKDLTLKLNRAFEYQNFTVDKSNLKWNLFRIRPANHPVRRIVQAAYIVIDLLDKGVLKPLMQAMQVEAKDSLKALNNFLKELLQPETEFAKEIQKPGQALISIITGNIILPMLYLYAQKTNDDATCSKIKQIYHIMPGKQADHIVHFMQRYMTDKQAKESPNDFITQQGLLNIYYKYCKYRLCELCITEKQKYMQNM